MLAPLVAMYRQTDSILGTTLITIMLWLRQGLPTFCILYTIFVNDLITLLKQGCDNDGVLSWLHTLIVMNDTVLLATNRPNLMKKNVDDFAKILCRIQNEGQSK